MYLPNQKCFHEFPDGRNFFGLCDNRKVSVWLGFDGKKFEDHGTDKIQRQLGRFYIFPMPLNNLRRAILGVVPCFCVPGRCRAKLILKSLQNSHVLQAAFQLEAPDFILVTHTYNLFKHCSFPMHNPNTIASHAARYAKRFSLNRKELHDKQD